MITKCFYLPALPSFAVNSPPLFGSFKNSGAAYSDKHYRNQFRPVNQVTLLPLGRYQSKRNQKSCT